MTAILTDQDGFEKRVHAAPMVNGRPPYYLDFASREPIDPCYLSGDTPLFAQSMTCTIRRFRLTDQISPWEWRYKEEKR